MLFPGFSAEWLELRMELQARLMVRTSSDWTCQEDLVLMGLIQASFDNPSVVEALDLNSLFPHKDICQVLQREEYLRAQLPRPTPSEVPDQDCTSTLGPELRGGLTADDPVDCGTFHRSSQVYLSQVGCGDAEMEAASVASILDHPTTDSVQQSCTRGAWEGGMDPQSHRRRHLKADFISKRSQSPRLECRLSKENLGKRCP